MSDLVGNPKDEFSHKALSVNTSQAMRKHASYHTRKITIQITMDTDSALLLFRPLHSIMSLFKISLSKHF